MTLLDLWRNRGAGTDCGDLALNDLLYDDEGWLVEEQPRALVGITPEARPDGNIVAGRIRWDKVLAGFIAPGKLDWQTGWQGRGAPVMDAHPAAILWHWTAGKPTPQRPCPSLVICRDGRPAGRGVTAVPGPLVHAIIGTDGVLHVLASGRANHAGTGHREVLQDMRAGREPRGTARAQGWADTGGSGGSLIGVEVENDGRAPFTDAQLDTIARFGRACYRLGLGRIQASHWGHELWTRRKVDCGTQQARIIAAYDAWTPLRP